MSAQQDVQVAVGAAAAAAGWWVVTQVASVDLAVRSGSSVQEVGVLSVVITAVVASLVGAWLLHVVERRSSRGLSIWTAVAVAVLAVSLAGPLGATSTSAGICLAALHLIVALVVIFGLRARRADGVA